MIFVTSDTEMQKRAPMHKLCLSVSVCVSRCECVCAPPGLQVRVARIYELVTRN